MKNIFFSNRTAAFFAIILSVFFVVSAVHAASTVGMNLQTDGTLNVTGQSSFLANVGIGTTSPQYLLDIQKSSGGNILNLLSANSYAQFQGVSYRNSGITHVAYDGYGYRGTQSAPLPINWGDAVTSLRAEAYMGTPGGGGNGDGTNEIAEISFKADEDQSATGHGGQIWFSTNDDSAMVGAANFMDSRMWIGGNDNIGIGTGAINCAPTTICFINEKADAGFPTQVYFGSSENPLGGHGFGAAYHSYSTKVVIQSGTSQSTVPLLTIVGTAATSTFTATGSLGVGSSTPVANFQVANGTNATTTMEVGSSGQNKGSCLKLYRTDGSAIYAYVAAGATTFTLTTTACANVSNF